MKWYRSTFSKDSSVNVIYHILINYRIKLKDDVEKRPKVKQQLKQESYEFVEEMDSDDEEPSKIPDTYKKEEIIEPKEGNSEIKEESDQELKQHKSESKEVNEKAKMMYGPMRPPENYVIPEDYFNQETDRDLPEIEEKDAM